VVAGAWGNAEVAEAMRQSAAMNSSEAAVRRRRSMGNFPGVAGMSICART
jgi:hypothetical protein